MSETHLDAPTLLTDVKLQSLAKQNCGIHLPKRLLMISIWVRISKSAQVSDTGREKLDQTPKDSLIV